MVRWIIDHGGRESLFERNKRGEIPLVAAATAGHSTLAEFLMRAMKESSEFKQVDGDGDLAAFAHGTMVGGRNWDKFAFTTGVTEEAISTKIQANDKNSSAVSQLDATASAFQSQAPGFLARSSPEKIPVDIGTDFNRAMPSSSQGPLDEPTSTADKSKVTVEVENEIEHAGERKPHNNSEVATHLGGEIGNVSTFEITPHANAAASREDNKDELNFNKKDIPPKPVISEGPIAGPTTSLSGPGNVAQLPYADPAITQRLEQLQQSSTAPVVEIIREMKNSGILEVTTALSYHEDEQARYGYGGQSIRRKRGFVLPF